MELQSAVAPIMTTSVATVKKSLPQQDWSNLAQVVYKRTYARKILESVHERTENWEETVRRVIDGNIRKYRGTNLIRR
jgi:hypothetical protein